MKKIGFTLLAVILMISLVACNSSSGGSNGGSSSDATKTVEFRVGYVGATNEFAGIHAAATRFNELVSEATGGAIKLNQFPGGQLGGERDMFESIQNGSLDMGFLSLGIMDSFNPNFTGIQLPFLVTDKETEYKLYTSDVVKEALETFEDINIKAFALVSVGFRNFGTNGKPIEKPEDFQGQKIRAPESPMLLESFAHLGMNTTPIPYPDVYTAMQTGVINGMDQPMSQWYGQRFYEVVDSISVMRAYPWPIVIVMNKDKFDGLTADQQAAFVEAAAEVQKYMSEEVVDRIDAMALEKLLEENVTIIQDIDIEPFRQVMEPIYEKYANSNDFVKRTIETVNEIRANK